LKANINWMFLGGRIRKLTISNTAGNVATALSPGQGKRWLVLRGNIHISTDATTADRSLNIYVTDGTNITCYYPKNNTPVTASQTADISFANYGNGVDVTRQARGHIGIPNILLEGSDELKLVIANGQAGDTYNGYVVVLEVDI